MFHLDDVDVAGRQCVAKPENGNVARSVVESPAKTALPIDVVDQYSPALGRPAVRIVPGIVAVVENQLDVVAHDDFADQLCRWVVKVYLFAAASSARSIKLHDGVYREWRTTG